MSPYRSGRDERPAPPPPETGLVGEMVRQFADPYAFLRELVQNGMDAGARRIAVRVERSMGGLTTTSVHDDGCGMTRDTIEGPLLTLFSSSKEGVEGKIGKYGVGFISVLALGPDAVEVETWRDGQAFRLVLRTDTSYELEDLGPREGSGTRVTLMQRMEAADFAGHAARARAALRRWCRHADRPIEIAVIDHGGEAGEAGAVERIDTPLAVRAAASITITEGDLTVAVGPSAGARYLGAAAAAAGEGDPELGERFAGFYNRGLTLFETAEEVFPGLEGVRFKAMSPRFQHTLSRDNVRRDDAFREAIGRARDAARGPLRREVAARLGPAAEAAAQGRGREAERYLALVEAALTPPTRLDPAEIPFPLAHPTGGRTAAADLGAMLTWRAPLLLALRADAVTEALAARGVPAVLLVHPDLRSMLGRCYPRLRLVEARKAYLLVEPAEGALDEASLALLEALSEALSRARHEVARIAYCRVEGALSKRAGLLLPEGDEPFPRLAAAADVERRGARFRPADALHLNARTPTVEQARAAAAVDPVVAAALLARALILEAQRPLDAGDADLLLDLGRAGRLAGRTP